jgi:hypothetical protein
MHRLKDETVHLYPFQVALPSTHGLRQKRRCGRVRGARTPSSSWRVCRRRRCSCVRRVVEEEVEDVGTVETHEREDRVGPRGTCRGWWRGRSSPARVVTALAAMIQNDNGMGRRWGQGELTKG